LPTITGVCTPACLLAASISVEAVTPPLWDWPLKIHFQSSIATPEVKLLPFRCTPKRDALEDGRAVMNRRAAKPRGFTIASLSIAFFVRRRIAYIWM